MISVESFTWLMKAADFDGVGGALEFAQIGSKAGRGVWAYYIPDGDDAEASRGTQRIEQRITDSFILALWVPTYGGNKASDRIKQAHDKAIEALLGWVPPIDGATALEYAGGRLNSIEANSVIWAQRWRYSFYIRKDVQ